jgi:protein TonB
VPFPDLEAQFIGGDLIQFIKDAIEYPDLAMEEGAQGKVIVQFTIEVDGSITNPTIVKGVSPELDNEAIRVVRSLPNFNAAISNGKMVRSTKLIPINFILN